MFRHLMRGLGFLAFGVGLAVLEATQEKLSHILAREPAHFWWIFRHVLPAWLVLAALMPLVVLLARRIPLKPDDIAKPILIHALAAPAFVFAHLGILAIFWRAANRIDAIWPFLAILLVNYTLADLVIYWAIAGSVLARDYYTLLRVRDVTATQLNANFAQARLRLLRAQLNPHFLFNSLNSVAMLARAGDTSAAVSMLAKLGDLLRYVLGHTDEEEVTLDEELDFVRRYLELERVRFRGRLSISVDADPALGDALVPMLVLQPLVENAVRHGIESERANAQLTVTASRSDGTLLLQVCDNGRGIRDGARSEKEGIGLANTRERVAWLYGDESALALANRDGGGVIATVSIPYHTARV